MVQTFQAAAHQVLYCNEEINLMFLFMACGYFLFFCVSVHTFLYIFLNSSVVIPYLQPLFILLLVGHYLHAPFYSSVFQSSTFPVSSSDYQSLSTCSFIFFCSSVICIPCLIFLLVIYMFLLILLFIGYYLHVPF